MAFQSGTASSYADLKSTIESFLTGAPGYTLTSGILTKTGTLLHLAFESTSTSLLLEMGKDSSAGSLLHTHVALRNGSEQKVGVGDKVYDNSTAPVFPIDYYFFYFSSPVEMFRCVIGYNNGYTQNIGFGGLLKAGAYFGGVYVDASAANDFTNVIDDDGTDNTITWELTTGNHLSFRSPLPFGSAINGGALDEVPASTQVWAEVAGFDWWTIGQSDPNNAIFDGTKYERAVGGWATGIGTETALLTSIYSQPEAENSLQTHNGNNVLVPIRVFGHLPNNNIMRLGDINDIRWTNIKHRNFAEIMDDGTDKWMCFPAFFKDASQVNGTNTHSGQIGYAVRYDGP